MSIYCQKWQRRNRKCRNLRVMLKANLVKWSDNEREYDNDDDDDGHIVYLMKCPRCSWKYFYWGKNAQCMICDEQSPLLFSHVIGFCELCSYGTSNTKAGGMEFTSQMDK